MFAAMHFLLAALVIPAAIQAMQFSSSELGSGKKPTPPIVLEVSNLLGAAGPVAIEVIPGSESVIYEVPRPVTPTKACIRGASLTSCFETTTGRGFGQPVTANRLDLGEGHSGLLLTATVNDLAGSTRMVAVLGLNKSGQLVTLLPFTEIGSQDQFQHWDGRSSSEVRLTVANVEWGQDRHSLWGLYPYRIKTYEFCRADGKFVMADQFVTKHEYALADAGDGRLLNLNDLLPKAEARLVRRYGTGQNACRKKS